MVSVLTVIIIVIVVVLLIYLISVYNMLVGLRNNNKKSYSNIDVLLKQRNDEIPNLVETVKGYMKHERNLLEQITKIRSAITGAHSMGERAAADNMMHDALKTLFAVAENYPKLKANENFMKLQNRITGLENEIADRREFYNESVTIYNTRIESFPTLVFAKLFSFKHFDWFKATEKDKKAVKTSF